MERTEASSKSTLQELENVRASLAVQCAALQGELQVKTEALDAKTEALERSEAMSASATELASVRETLENQLTMVQTELQSKSEALVQAEQARATATQDADTVRSTFESQIAALQAELAEKSRELESAVAATSSVHDVESKLAQALEAAQASDVARQALESQIATLQVELQDKAQISERHDTLLEEKSVLDASLREANERLSTLQDEIKQAAEKDASAAEALALAEKDAAKAKDNVASIASASATQFAQERQMMKNALGELQTERDILVKMLKTFHQHSHIQSTSVSKNVEEASSVSDSFMKRFTDSPSIASVFTPRKPPPPPPASP
jgi:chromosome segregation ATPase